jgi:hypothetical protein
MRAGKIGRLVVRAVIVGALTAGAWAAATAAAHAEFEWTISPAEQPSNQQEPQVRPVNPGR